MAVINDNSNVRFLLGTQADLEGYITGKKSATNGTFYLTKDTHRLYIGDSEHKAVPVNEGVITVASVENLPVYNSTTGAGPHPGEFYYATAENVLCVYASIQDTASGATKTGWVQINSNTDTYIIAQTSRLSAVKGTTDTFKVTNDSTQNNGAHITSEFNIQALEGVTASIDTTTNTLKLTGVRNNAFSSTADDTGASTVVTITLTDTQGNAVNQKITAGNNITLAADATDGITIGAKDMTNQSVEISSNDGTTTNGFNIAVTDSGGTKADTLDPVIQVGDTKVDVHFKNGVAELPVYTKAEIDAQKLALNSMTYKGLVGNTADAASGRAAWSSIWNTAGMHHIGDTYLFAEDAQYTDNGTTFTIKKGSLAIARGTESSDGTLANPLWDIVEDSGDTDTTYTLSNTSTVRKNGEATTKGSVQLLGARGGVRTPSGTLTFADGTSILVNVSADTDNKNATITVAHADVAHTTDNKAATQNRAVFSASNNTAQATTAVKVVTGLEVNDQGHVTKINTKDLTLEDTNATINTFTTAAGDVVSNKANIISTLAMKDGTGTVMTPATANLAVESNSLQFSKNKTTNNIHVDLVWGTFE